MINLLRPLVLLLLLACGALPGAAQRRAAPAPLRVDSQVRVGQLPNGLRYYIRASREPANRAEFRLAVDAGSILEDRDQRGLAHFLEHMAFNGTRNFEKQALVDYLESIGMRFGPDVNAYTSFDETVYMLTLPTDVPGVVETGLQILEDWAHGMSLDSVEIEKERGVVTEEWRLGQSAGSRMQKAQFPVLAHRSRYAERDPIGTYESLQSFDHEALRRFYRDWYRPDLMAVVAVGDFDARYVEDLIRAHFSRVPAPSDPRPRRAYGVADHRRTLVSVVTDPEATASSVSLYLKRSPEPWRTEAAYRRWIVESLASSMLTNRLSELTQRPDAPFLDVSSFHGRFLRPLAAYVLSVRVPDAGIEGGLDALLTEVERAARHGFVDTELEREKREMLRRMEQRMAERDKISSASFASDYVSAFLYGGVPVDVETEFALYQRFLPRITLAEVNAQAREWMGERNRVVLVRAPAQPGVEVPTAQALRERISSGRRPTTPYTDSLSSAPLIARAPEPGRVVEARVHDPAGVHEWTLSNGVRVLLKPTDFKEDEVLLAARSPGGTSLVPDDDYIAALTAAAVVQVGGVGTLSANELRKWLAGRVVGVGADIGDTYEGLSGAASPRDLETLFQLVYLKFTAPRVDSAAFRAYQAQARSTVENRAASPEVVFSDSLRSILTRGHLRRRPASPEMFDRLDLHRSFEIYRDRFADASDFTFYLVGSFEPDSLRPLVEQYLGSLPALHREESPRDLGIRPPRGVVRSTVRRGVEPKALTQLVFTGEFPFGRDELVTMNALGEVLRLRLREVLREELGGTYGVEVRAVGWRDPEPQYQISIGFGADPARLDELTRAVFAQLDTLKTRGPTARELAKVHEMQLRGREIDLRSNHFWIGQLMAHDRYDWDVGEIARFQQLFRQVDAAGIRAAAARYLNTANYVQLSLVPEQPPTPGAAREPTGMELPE